MLLTRKLGIIVTCVGCAAAQNSYFFQNVRVFDGTRVIETTNVAVANGTVMAIGAGVQQPGGAEVIDGAGKTLLPALIDAHVHAFAPGVLEQSLAFGVGTVLDMFTDTKFVAAMKKQQTEGQGQNLADIRSAGTLVTSPGGHGTEYGLKIPTITNPADAQAFVDARIAEGSDYIKLVYDDAAEYGVPARPTLAPAVMKAVIQAAHKRGKLAVVHIGTEAQAREAIADGADGIVHLFIGEHAGSDFGKFAAAHHVFVIPTLTVLHTICADPANAALANDPHFRSMLAPSDMTALQAKFPLPAKASCNAAGEAVKQLQSAHVPMLTGTDAPNPGTDFGISEHGELDNLVKAGLTPAEALAAATSVPAHIFRLDDRGVIAPGKRADLLLVNGNPVADILATRDIAGVWKQGVKDDRAVYVSKVQKERDSEKNEATLPPPQGSESGLVSDFEADQASAKFGAWAETTDAMMGGKSTAAIKVVPGGANGSKGALDVSGEINSGFAFPWGGAMFSPATAPMQPANLSGKSSLSFWAKGDGQAYRVMIYAKSKGFTPGIKTFVAGPGWKQYDFPFTDFAGVDPHGIMSVIFCGGAKPGAFDFQIDDVRFK